MSPARKSCTKGSQAALAGQWADALHYYEQAAEQGRAEALSMLGELLYEGKGVRRSAVQARRMWKKGRRGRGRAGHDRPGRRLHGLWQGAGGGAPVLPSGADGGPPHAGYRLHAAGAAPDGPIRDTVPLPAPGALAEMAEAKQGFKIQLGEGDPAAEQWLQETEDAIRRLLGDEKR